MEQEKLLEAWIEAHTKSLLNLAFTYVRDWAAAEDRVQDVFIKAFRAKDTWIYIREPYSWLARIVINECISFYRKMRHETTLDSLPDLVQESAEDVYLRSEARREIHDAVRALPARMSGPMTLFYFRGLSVDHVSKVLAVKAVTVRTRLMRGRQRLRDEIYSRALY
ncbi:RNA polymerase sigma factor [Paenibacillus sp. GP183]|uniref:RNA polymerase sigma factor n=1 Tax=Paenibacillus sp. GP183 TaxID=1882751 RepID=UPI00089841C0|nr:RNA polymerase sigma factor [Paenibacillus sp. GP183]SEB98855.1 RNA polymerase sigma-70 factor, ECF subfamily [Paenibacillus sp. GP183]